MKHVSKHAEVCAPTLQDVVDRIAVNSNLSSTRKRDLRSAVLSFWKAG